MTERRPRLVVVASTFPGLRGDGTPEFIRDLSLRLGAEFDTVVLVPRVPDAPAREEASGVVIERFRYFPRRWEDLAHGAIIENLRSRPTRWLQVGPFVLAEAFRLWRLVRRHRPDVVHIHWIIPQGLAAMLTARGTPWVVTTLGGDVYALNDPVTRRMKRAVLRRACAVTTMNADMRDRLIEAGAAPATTFVQPLGADLAAIRAMGAGEKRIPGRVLFVGRMVEKKGLAVLLDAVRRLPEGLDWSLQVAGDGPLRAELEAQASGLPIEFTGSASREDLARAYARSSVMVVPSVPASSGDQDGLPTVLLEAMGAGCAIVASDLPGIDEAVEHRVNGLLVPPADPDKLAGALAEVLTDTDLAEELGRTAAAAQRRVRRRGLRSTLRRDPHASRSHGGRHVTTDAIETTPPDAAERGWRWRITQNRRAIDLELATDPDARKQMSPALFGLTEALAPRLVARASGTLPRRGAGTQPFRSLVEPHIEPLPRLRHRGTQRRRRAHRQCRGHEGGRRRFGRHAAVLRGPRTRAPPARGHRRVRAACRLPGGALVLTVPFLARLHEEPYDFFRYTRHGLRTLLEDGGFEVDDLVETGSLFSFVGHQVSVVLLGLTWHRPRLRRLTVASTGARRAARGRARSGFAHGPAPAAGLRRGGQPTAAPLGGRDLDGGRDPAEGGTSATGGGATRGSIDRPAGGAWADLVDDVPQVLVATAEVGARRDAIDVAGARPVRGLEPRVVVVELQRRLDVMYTHPMSCRSNNASTSRSDGQVRYVTYSSSERNWSPHVWMSVPTL